MNIKIFFAGAALLALSGCINFIDNASRLNPNDPQFSFKMTYAVQGSTPSTQISATFPAANGATAYELMIAPTPAGPWGKLGDYQSTTAAITLTDKGRRYFRCLGKSGGATVFDVTNTFYISDIYYRDYEDGAGVNEAWFSGTASQPPTKVVRDGALEVTWNADGVGMGLVNFSFPMVPSGKVGVYMEYEYTAAPMGTVIDVYYEFQDGGGKTGIRVPKIAPYSANYYESGMTYMNFNPGLVLSQYYSGKQKLYMVYTVSSMDMVVDLDGTARAVNNARALGMPTGFRFGNDGMGLGTTVKIHKIAIWRE